MELKPYYLSFGGNSPFGRYMLKIDAYSEGEVRAWAHDHLGDCGWCGIYEYAKAHEMMRDYDLGLIFANDATLKDMRRPGPTPHAHLDY